MRKFWLIFWYEYRRHVFTWRFVLKHFVIPWASALLMGSIMLLVLVVGANRAPVGYVDQAGLLDAAQAGGYQLPAFLEGYLGTDFIAYPSETQASAAMTQGAIQGYYVLPPEFRQTRAARLVYRKSPSLSARTRFESKVQNSLLAEIPQQKRARLTSGPYALVFTLSSNAGPEERGSLALLRFFLVYAYILLVFSTLSGCSGYLSRTVLDEKTNRTIEIMVTSVSPNELMLSKLVSLISVGLTDLLITTGLPALGLVALAFAGLSVTRILPFSLLTLALLLGLGGLTFILLSTLIATYGAAAVKPGEVENQSLFVMGLMMFFFLFLLVAMFWPEHPLLVIFSFFPLTAFPALLARLAFSSVPDGQLVISGLLLAAACAGAVWAVGRVFRTGMLQYGKRLGLREVLRSLVNRSA